MAEKTPFIDIHTHSLIATIDALSIVSFSIDQKIPFIPKGQNISVGLHPWNIENRPNDWIKQLEEAIQKHSVTAIGEAGLDRIKGPSIDLQKKILIEQVVLAEEQRLPLIIHCVKAFYDLIQIKKESRSTVPWILHGYNGNENTTQELIKHQFFFSFGKQLFSSSAKASESIKQIPTERLFFETDDSNQSIDSTYQKASSILNIPLNLFIGMIFDNYQQIFIKENLNYHL